MIGLGLISGVGSLASGLLNNSLSQGMSKDLMRYQYQLQQQAIDKMNLYNSPQQQMIRLSQAQLNPNLVYGSGVDGNQSSAASPSMANVRSQLGNPLQGMADAYYQSKQLALQERQMDLSERSSAANIALTEAKTLGQLLQNNYDDKTMEDRIKMASQRLANGIAEEYNIWARTRNEENKLDLIWAEVDSIKSKTNLTDQQALTEVVKRNAIEAGIELTHAQVAKIAAEIPFIKAGTNLRELAAKIQGVDFDATKAGDQWLAENPNVAVVYSLLLKMLGLGKGVKDIIM